MTYSSLFTVLLLAIAKGNKNCFPKKTKEGNKAVSPVNDEINNENI